MAKDSTASGLNECGGRGFGRVKLFRLKVVSIVTSAPLSFGFEISSLSKSITKKWGNDTTYGTQILPGENNMDGFFYACLVKSVKC